MTGVEELDQAIDTARAVTLGTDCHMRSGDGQTEIIGVNVLDTARVMLLPGREEARPLHVSDTQLRLDGGAVQTLVYLNDMASDQPDRLVTRVLGHDGQPEGDDSVITTRQVVIAQAKRLVRKATRETEEALAA